MPNLNVSRKGGIPYFGESKTELRSSRQEGIEAQIEVGGRIFDCEATYQAYVREFGDAPNPARVVTPAMKRARAAGEYQAFPVRVIGDNGESSYVYENMKKSGTVTLERVIPVPGEDPNAFNPQFTVETIEVPAEKMLVPPSDDSYRAMIAELERAGIVSAPAKSKSPSERSTVDSASVSSPTAPARSVVFGFGGARVRVDAVDFIDHKHLGVLVTAPDAAVPEVSPDTQVTIDSLPYTYGFDFTYGDKRFTVYFK